MELLMGSMAYNTTLGNDDQAQSSWPHQTEPCHKEPEPKRSKSSLNVRTQSVMDR